VEEAPRTNRTGLAAGIIGAVLLLGLVAIVFDLGPFSQDDLSAAEFLSQGDEICAETHDEFLDVQGSTPRTAAEAEMQVEALIELATQERDEIAELNGPESLSEEVAAYLKERDDGISILEDGLTAARDDDPQAYEEAQAKLASQQAKRQATARDLGFSECSAPLVSKEELERQAQPPSGGQP
jgi:hypothetical protein